MLNNFVAYGILRNLESKTRSNLLAFEAFKFYCCKVPGKETSGETPEESPEETKELQTLKFPGSILNMIYGYLEHSEISKLS